MWNVPIRLPTLRPVNPPIQSVFISMDGTKSLPFSIAGFNAWLWSPEDLKGIVFVATRKSAQSHITISCEMQKYLGTFTLDPGCVCVFCEVHYFANSDGLGNWTFSFEIAYSVPIVCTYYGVFLRMDRCVYLNITSHFI